MHRLWFLSLALVACFGSSTPPPGDEPDAAPPEIDAAPIDASAACLTPAGESGDCMPTASCAAIADHVSIAHACPGPVDIQCCVITPSVAHNPPVPAGYKLMTQAQVTSDMTTWAVDILHDPVMYPLYATTTRMFGALVVLARVEWHPPDFNNNAIHRGVTLYVPS